MIAAGLPDLGHSVTCGKVPFASAEEAHWYATTRRAMTSVRIYRCFACDGQFHLTSQSKTEAKRRVKATRKCAS